MSMSFSAVILSLTEKFPMSDDHSEVIMAAIRSAFSGYPKEGGPDWRSPMWIMPEECAHLTRVAIRELSANGFQIVRKQE